MRVTFLGHQGWQFENKGRSLLLDPIREAIGNGAAKMPIWPQRRLDFNRFEPIEAVIVSHEHADHFSLDTLEALPKHCRIYISDLSSSAMEAIIAEMGFQVQRFGALQSFTVCGLRITALPGIYNMLEPDTYALLVQDDMSHEDGRASFLTSIDTIPHPDLFVWLQANCPVRTLDNLTNNFVEPRHSLILDPTSFVKSHEIVSANAAEFVRNFKPRRAVISGQGWSFGGTKSDLNHSFFSVDNRSLTHSAARLAPHVEWFEGVPGMRFSLDGNQLTLDHSPLIGPLQFPNRAFSAASVQVPDPYPPWSEATEIPADRSARLREFIARDFGRVVGAHAPALMERLYYLKCQAAGFSAFAATLALILRNGQQRTVFEFDYGQLVFREMPFGTGRECAVGIEMWASDLELIINAEEEAFSVYESAVRPWSRVPDLIPESTLNEVFMWFTPRFRPLDYLDAYRRRVMGRMT